MSKARVLIVGPDPGRSHGGMATVITGLLDSELLCRQFDVECYPSFVDGSLAQRALFAARSEARFRSKVGVYDIYHIHICSGESTWRKMRYVKQLGNLSHRVVLHVHGARYHRFFKQCNERQKGRIRQLFASVGVVIVLSEEWRTFFEREEICDPAKVFVVHNAVSVPDQDKADYAANQVLFLGRLGERKSPDVLIKAASIVSERHPEARYVFGGDGDEAAYQKMANELGVASACTFAGWVTGKAKECLFSQSTIYCLPSKDEGMPMSVLEAMAHGLAVITTPVGGVPQVIQDGVNGSLVPVGDHGALADKLLEFMDDAALKERIGKTGRQTIQDRFGLKAFSEQIASIYERVCE